MYQPSRYINSDPKIGVCPRDIYGPHLLKVGLEFSILNQLLFVDLLAPEFVAERFDLLECIQLWSIGVEVLLQVCGHLFVIGKVAAIEGSNQSEALDQLRV